MDLGKTIAALPWLRRLWRALPGPLKLPLLAVALFMWWRRRGSDDGPDEPSAAGPDEPSADEPAGSNADGPAGSSAGEPQQ